MKTSGKYIFGLGAVAFVLNWFWEMAQMFAFELKPGSSRIQVFIFCTLATAVDALVTIGIYGLLARVNWASRAAFYLFAAALGASCAVLFELSAVRFGLWSYNELMPVVPLLKVGLLPLAQLALLVPLATWTTEKIADRIARRK